MALVLMWKRDTSMCGRHRQSGTLFAADYEGRLSSINAENGRMNWQLKTEQEFSGGPGLDESRIYMHLLAPDEKSI